MLNNGALLAGRPVDLDRGPGPIAVRHRHLRPDGRAARPRTTGPRRDFPHHSIIGSEFIGQLTGERPSATVAAVLPTVTGRAWITGRSQWVLDETDPFPTGYTLGDIWAPQPSARPQSTAD